MSIWFELEQLRGGAHRVASLPSIGYSAWATFTWRCALAIYDKFDLIPRNISFKKKKSKQLMRFAFKV